MSKELEILTAISKGDNAIDRGVLELGPTTPFTCPECSGVLVRLKEGGVPTFRCHTGHAFSFDTLTAATTEHPEEMLWNALRAIEEVMLLLQHSAAHAHERRDERTAASARQHAEDTQRRADLLRTVLQQHRALAQAVLDGAGDRGSGAEEAGDARTERAGEAAGRAS